MAISPIYLDVEEEIPELIERIKQTTSEEVQVVVPAHSKLGQSRFNFQLLHDYARRLDKKIAIISPDVAVQQMAMESGFSAFAETATQGGFGYGYGHEPAAAERAFPVAPAAGAKSATKRPSRLVIPRPRRPAALQGTGPARFMLYAGAAMLLVSGVVASAVFVPSAQVTLVAKATEFSHSTSFDAAPGAAPVRIRTITSNKTATHSFTATGTKVTPAVFASGQVVFTDRCPDVAFTVPQGQRVMDSSGHHFAVTDGGVAVRGNSNASANIIAAGAGVSGNVGANTINTIEGRSAGWTACMSVTNPSATANGADEKHETQVSQGDLDSAKAQLQSDLQATVTDDLNKQAQPGEKLGDSVDFQIQFTADKKVDDVVPNFNGNGTMTGSGALYQVEDVKKAILGDLKKNVPTGTALTDNAPAIDYRVTTSTPDGHMSFFGTAKGFVAPSLDFSKIKSRLSGQSTAAARIYLGTLPIESAQVSQKPVSLPLMPILGSRIKIVYEVQTTKPPAVTPKA